MLVIPRRNYASGLMFRNGVHLGGNTSIIWLASLGRLVLFTNTGRRYVSSLQFAEEFSFFAVYS